MTISSRFPALKPTLMLDFSNAGLLDSRITFTRSSVGTYFDSLGVLQTAAANVPRFDHNPTTLESYGLLIEESRTNSIRNNTMQGAVAGSPGTQPAKWWTAWTSLIQGLQYSIAGVGTEGGISYVDVNVQGTFTGTVAATSNTAGFEGPTIIAASQGQAWTTSAYITLISGSLQNCELTLRLGEYDSGGVAIASSTSPAIIVTAGILSRNRKTYTATTANINTASIVPILRFVYTAQQAYNFTIRVGMPQLELGAFATSVIPTSTAAVTRAVDSANITGTNFSNWFNGGQGAVVSEYIVSNSTTNQSSMALSDGTSDNRMIIRATNTSQQTAFIGVDVTVTQWGGTISTAPVNSITKSSFAYIVNNIAWVRNAGTVGTDTLATIPAVSRLRIGADGDGSLSLNGCIRRVAYYPLRITNTNLQAVTS